MYLNTCLHLKKKNNLLKSTNNDICNQSNKKTSAGLATLFFTELWERFSYYGMRAILVLYLISEQNISNPGLGWTNAEAIQLYGWYTALVYLVCIPGGIVGDKLISTKMPSH